MIINKTKKAFREYLNQKENAIKHKHHRYNQRIRPYGDYLYRQDKIKFDGLYQEWKENPKRKTKKRID